jgi:AbrB family looped-hinge helix DNA binding protein
MMGTTSTVSSKGQVTVPIAVRRRLGLKEGDRVEFAFEEGKAVLRPVRTDGNPFLKWIGALGSGQASGHAVAWIRDLRDPEDDGGE